MKHLPSSEMESILRAGAAGFGALILILLFAIYVRFFPTPVSYLFGYGEPFTAATVDTPATGTSRQSAPSHNL